MDRGKARYQQGRLQLTSVAKVVIDDPISLWKFLANAIVETEKSEAYRWAIKLFAIEVAAGGLPSHEDYLGTVANEMDAVGWFNSETHESLTSNDIFRILSDSWRTMNDLSVFEPNGWRRGFEPTRAGRLFALAMIGGYGIG